MNPKVSQDGEGTDHHRNGAGQPTAEVGLHCPGDQKKAGKGYFNSADITNNKT